MHTSSGADNIDEFAERIERTDSGTFARYGAGLEAVRSRRIAVPYKSTDGSMAKREFQVWYTRHGPVVRQADRRWISVSLMQEPIKALTQSYSRTKASNYDTFRQSMELHTNSSNNTVFADADGTIAYFHANFVPKRNARYDWRVPVDGSDPGTAWGPPHGLDDSPLVKNPASGWIQNTNNWPYSAAGQQSPKERDFPSYMDRSGENPRGEHAIEVLTGRRNFTLDSLLAAAFDPHLPAFEKLLPPLVTAWERLPASAPLKAKLAEQVAMLRTWNRRWGVESVPTSLAVFWGEEVWRVVRADAESEAMSVYDYLARRAPATALLSALDAASDKLAADFGTWKTPWGEINRFQRISPAIESRFDDAAPSIPVGFTSSRWGSLASFGARAWPNTKKWYGTSGNSFVAVVEFGDSVRARAVSAGGESGDSMSTHFNDQAERYATGNFREVYFYPSQLKGHTEREYRPGEKN
jgi:acyl-homoserine-lactone acylase